MKTKSLQYYLPGELIAQHPAEVRSDSRLLVLDRTDNRLTDTTFSELGRFLLVGDCLVLNNTKVLPARFFAKRLSGGKLEGLFLAETAVGLWEVMLKGAGKIRPGEKIELKDRKKATFCRARLLEKKDGGRCRLKIETDTSAQTILGKIGFAPLPPYIRRDDNPLAAKKDKIRYQTVYAQHSGAVAAPTAGLHFTKKLIEQLKTAGVLLAYVTLHTGTGTFKPINTENIEDHQMHGEKFSIDEKNAWIMNQTKEKGRRIIAVGSTSVRSIETIACGRGIRPYSGTTSLFIKPGYKFKMVDAMVTNFHLPKSTLLALVAAFAGLENILAAYKHAIKERYRFYSYGDAMLII